MPKRFYAIAQKQISTYMIFNMCKVICIMNQKGGVGKTTIATNLASELLRMNGSRVLLVDGDPQGSSRKWCSLGDGRGVLVVGLDGIAIDRDIKRIRDGYDYIIVDSPGSMDGLSVAIIKAADFIIIPTKASQDDILVTAITVKVIKERQEIADGKPKAFILLSCVDNRSKKGKDVSEEALKGLGFPIFKSRTSYRTAFPKSFALGQSVCEFDPSGPSAVEIQQITKELLGYIGEDKY